MMGFVMFRAIEPREESFVLSPDSEGQYSRVIDEDDFRVEIADFGNGRLDVSFEPATGFGHYLIWLVVAFLVGAQHYRSLKQPTVEVEVEDEGFALKSNEPRNEDPLYENFLQEDVNRRLFPRPLMEDEFEAWQTNRGGSEDSE